MAVSAARVYRAAPSPARSRALTLWGAQQALNAAWSPLFFGQRRPRAALLDLGLLWGTLGGYALQARKVDPVASALVGPYLGWVSFACPSPCWLLVAARQSAGRAMTSCNTSGASDAHRALVTIVCGDGLR
jgi:tryptophan-rich sensory protein